ncbi:uncharacterized protein [Elaeis guineensis]|uniref:Uncharacterized protein LOC105051447 n=1 Tax=Elaeis guineensis var. tenera TaxID=51953 RepID=A0A6I9RPE8_ELAGV|nr:uncharacterized protein LOC105051447 [Elaeis guineensis]
MGFIGSIESSQQARDFLPTIQSVSMIASTHGWSKNGLRDHKAGLDQNHTETPAFVVAESETKDFDIEKQADYTEGLSDESEYRWLSSDGKSSSLFSSDDSQDIWEFDCWDLSLHDPFSSSLSLSESYEVLLNNGKGFLVFDGPKMSSTSETPLVLGRPCEDTEGKGLKEEFILQLHETVRDEVKDPQIGHSESGDTSYEIFVSENSSVTNCPGTSFNPCDDTPSRDFDGTDIWVSSLDLEGEDSKLIQDKEQVSDIFDSDFPSPSFSAKQNFQIIPTSCSSRFSIVHSDEVKNAVEESDSDEPLFWPFEHSSYRCPEFKNFLCLSPPKDGGIDCISGPHESKPIRLKLHQKNFPAGRQVSQGYGRRITFGPTPKSTVAERKTRGCDNDVQKTAASPSRLRKLSRATSDQHPCNISKKRRPPPVKIDVPKHASGQQILHQPLPEFEAHNLHELVMQGVPIEKFVGLNEFDGHEGINVEFEEDQFTFYASPCKTIRVMLAGNIDWSMDNSDHEGCNHSAMGIDESSQQTNDCALAHAKGKEDILDEQLGERHVHDCLLLSE